MGITLLFISVLLFAYFMIFMSSSLEKTVCVAASVILLAVVSVLLILNDTEHFGMKQVTQTQEKSLVSSTKSTQTPQLTYQKLGNGREKIYYYRLKSEQAGKLLKTNPMTTKVDVKRAAASRLKITKNYWVYRSPWSQFFFAGGQPNHQFIDQHYQFQLPSNWKLVQK